MPRGKRKTDSEFFEERIPFYLEHGLSLSHICPDCVDEYNDHSLHKLISIHYWVGFFNPITHRQLREKYSYKIAYVDSMAGSGVTSTKRANDYLCGSCTGAVLRSSDLGFPFDRIFAVEINGEKAEALEKRMLKIAGTSKVTVLPEDILKVSSEIADELKVKTKSFVVIDPEGFQGMTWKGIHPLLACKGDAMVTWFEHELWRLKQAAVSETEHSATKGDRDRLNELFGSEVWINAKSAQELTDIFINRVKEECGKTYAAKVKIPKTGGGYYLMILFTGFPNPEKLANDWKNNLEKRINSLHGREISSLLDVKTKRVSSLDDYI